MSATTINSFPSLHSLNSPRGVAMALIVLLHVGFFFALTSGLNFQSLPLPKPPTIADFIKIQEPTPPPQRPIDDVIVKHDFPVALTPPPEVPPVTEETQAVRQVQEVGPVIDTPIGRTGDVVPPAPVVVEPRMDPRRALSEPEYPAQEIRLGHEGTVLLSVFVQPNGRVGEVRLDRSSGFPRLDDSAMREAKNWRFQAGTRDGMATGMWKQLPITFRLDNK